MFKRFRMDVARWIIPQQVAELSQVTFGKTVKLLFWHPPLQAVMWFRIASWFRQKHLPFGGLIQLMLYFVYGLEITVGAEYGGGLYIAHPIGSVLAAHSMGENCTVIANVTIGMRNEWAFPRIGNNVFLGAGSRVLGDIVIGDDSVIGANAVVINNIPRGATVVGIPGKVIRISGKRIVNEDGVD